MPRRTYKQRRSTHPNGVRWWTQCHTLLPFSSHNHHKTWWAPTTTIDNWPWGPTSRIDGERWGPLTSTVPITRINKWPREGPSTSAHHQDQWMAMTTCNHDWQMATRAHHHHGWMTMSAHHDKWPQAIGTSFNKWPWAAMMLREWPIAPLMIPKPAPIFHSHSLSCRLPLTYIPHISRHNGIPIQMPTPAQTPRWTKRKPQPKREYPHHIHIGEVNHDISTSSALLAWGVEDSAMERACSLDRVARDHYLEIGKSYWRGEVVSRALSFLPLQVGMPSHKNVFLEYMLYCLLHEYRRTCEIQIKITQVGQMSRRAIIALFACRT